MEKGEKRKLVWSGSNAAAYLICSSLLRGWRDWTRKGNPFNPWEQYANFFMEFSKLFCLAESEFLSQNFLLGWKFTKMIKNGSLISFVDFFCFCSGFIVSSWLLHQRTNCLQDGWGTLHIQNVHALRLLFHSSLIASLFLGVWLIWVWVFPQKMTKTWS